MKVERNVMKREAQGEWNNTQKGRGKEEAEMTKKTKIIERNEKNGKQQQGSKREIGNRGNFKHKNGQKIEKGEKAMN